MTARAGELLLFAALASPHVAAPARINVLDGAIATSSTLRRRW